VTALAIDPANNDLLIKTGLDDTYQRCPAGAAYASQGHIVAGPFDAGVGLEWYRAACEAYVPRGTAVLFEIAQLSTAASPAPAEWVAALAPDTLLATVLPTGPPPATRRFLWLRATLTTRDPLVSPLLRNLRAETAGEDYRDYLPALYQRADEPGRFLDRFLALARTELAAVEEAIDAMPQAFLPDFAPASEHSWLAEWLGLDLPEVATDEQRRQLIARAATLYRRRGTPAAIAEFVEIYTGVRPGIVEAFTTRGLWVLDVSSHLDFDTALPASDPVGLVVPDPANPLTTSAGCCATPVGSAVVGASGPLPVEDLGTPLFTDTAHRFTVYLPAYRATQSAILAEVRRVIEAEKPAHTGYELCLIGADMRVGLQARVGIDTIVGGPPEPQRLNEFLLGLSGVLPPPLGNVARVGQSARVGHETRLG
jgi:phage tail-like protein